MSAKAPPDPSPLPERDGRLGHRFPTGFLFGAATSSFQIEGAVDRDGRGPSIWDTFCHTPGRVARGETGDTAVEHYDRWRDDVALMADLGLRAYRFSISWPRILPDGDGTVEPRGLAFYSRLVDALIDAGIEPVVTLYHWDLPQPLQDRGGWVNRDTVGAFVRYAHTVHAELGDRVTYWTTINEPWCAAFLGHASGEHAPGMTDPRAALRAAHHLLLAHGDAVRDLREAGRGEHRFGLVPNLYGVVPASGAAGDLRAAETIDVLQNRLWLDATLLGTYPDEVLQIAERFRAADAIHDGDLDRISAPLDLLGVNYYSQHHVREAAHGSPAPPSFPGAEHVAFDPPPAPRTAMGWSIEPGGLRELLLRLHDAYELPPIVISENGAAFDDEVAPDGQVHDAARQRFIADHLGAVAEALDAGVDVRGYLVWSLLDNSEWAHGHAKPLSIVHVDPATQTRTIKQSGHWYRALIARAGTP